MCREMLSFLRTGNRFRVMERARHIERDITQYITEKAPELLKEEQDFMLAEIAKIKSHPLLLRE